MKIFHTPSAAAYRLLIAALALCVVVYAAGLSGGFLFDDIPNIVENPSLNHLQSSNPDWLAVALLAGSGPLRRPISMLSLGMNVYVFGMDPFAFKCVNLIIHLINGILVFALWRRIAEYLLPHTRPSLRPAYIALLASTLWLLHPLHISSVLYVVQRMNLQAALFSFAGLLCYTEARVLMLRNQPGMLPGILGLALFGVLAVLSKENGALITAYAFVIEFFCFRFSGTKREQRLLKGFFFLTVALPAAAFLVYLICFAGILSYSRNGFTFYTHLLSDARVLCHYLAWIIAPLPSSLGMFHDDIQVSNGLFSPISTALSILFLLALVAVTWMLRRRFPGLAFGVAWFLVGHSMESSIIPLELVFEHRNYMPSAGLLFGMACSFAPFLHSRSSDKALAAGCFALIAVISGLSAARAASWGTPLSLAMIDATHHPLSSRSQYAAGREILAAAQRKTSDTPQLEARPYFERAAALDRYDVYAPSALIQIYPSTEQVSKEDVSDLARRLATARSSEQANPFLDLIIAAANGQAPLAPDDMSTLMDAALSNPRWRPTIRAMMFNNYGSYLFNIVHDQQGAIRLVVAAAAEDPLNPYFQINLSKIALVIGDLPRAKQYLKAAADLNKAGVYDIQIIELRKKIEQPINERSPRETVKFRGMSERHHRP